MFTLLKTFDDNILWVLLQRINFRWQGVAMNAIFVKLPSPGPALYIILTAIECVKSMKSLRYRFLECSLMRRILRMFEAILFNRSG